MPFRSTQLAPDQIDFILELKAKLGGWKFAAAELNTQVKNLQRWAVNGHGVDHSLTGRKFFERLDRLMAICVPHQDAADPIAEIDRLSDAGKAMHFQHFRPLDAFAQLQQIVYHRRAMQVPPLTLLKRFISLLAIYRQSKYASEGDFIEVGRRCIERLTTLRPSDRGEPLAACVCMMAWELTASAAQRGQAGLCVAMLDRIENLIKINTWKRIVPEVRPWSMTKMLHYSKVVAHPDFGHAQKLVTSCNNPIDAILQVPAPNSAETLNIFVQQLMQQIRMTLSMEKTAGSEAVDFFDSQYETIFKPLHKEIIKGITPQLAAFSTPSGALAASFLGFVLATLVPRARSSTIMGEAQEIYDRINIASNGALMLQSMNAQTMNFVRSDNGLEIIRRLPSLEFVGDFSVGGTRILLDQAERLLHMVEDCLPHVLSVTSHRIC